jgi:phosphoglycerol transferase MdoB-like AlkP superfamily enzyme
MPRYIRWLLFIALVFLLLMSIARITLFFVFKTSGQSVVRVLPAFWLGLRYDLRDVGILFVFLLLLGAIPFFRPFERRLGKVVWFTLLGIAAVLLTFIYTVDFGHYSYLSQRLNASMLDYIGNDESVGMVWQTYPILRILMGIVLAALLLLGLFRWCFRRLARDSGPNANTHPWIWGTLLFLLAGGAIFGHLGQYPLRWSDAFSLGDDRTAQLALNPFQSFFSSLKFRHRSVNMEKVKQYYPMMAGYMGVEHPDSVKLNYTRSVAWAGDTLGTHPNVVLVICESFSGYKSSMWGNPLNTTPFFNSMCRQGIFFDHCFTPHYGTARGVWATITGTPDVYLENTSSRNPQSVDQHSIMNDFAGYEKYYFIGGSTSWANIRGVLQNNVHGLHLYEESNYTSPRVDVWGISDKNLFLEANKVIKNERTPFFAIIQTSDNHRPYTIPGEDRAAFHDVSFPPDTLHKYGFQGNDELNAFRYTDFCYEKFIETARNEPYFKNTIFVFVGDHGIRGDAGNMLPRAWTDDGLTCFHVPLLFYAPGLLSPVRHTMNCSQIDIMPTIAGLTHMAYTNTTIGRDLLHEGDTTGNVSFMIDHDVRKIGVVMDGYFFSRQLTTDKERLVSINNNNPVPENTRMDSLRDKMRAYTWGMYETARYLLLNNHKHQ